MHSPLQIRSNFLREVLWGMSRDETIPPSTNMGHDDESDSSVLSLLISWDKELSYRIYRGYDSRIALKLPLKVLELSGHGVPWLAFPVALLVLHPSLSGAAASTTLNFFALQLLDLAVIGVLKPLFRRQRPPYNGTMGSVTIHAVDRFSFPSGHSTRAAFVAAFVVYSRTTHPLGLPALLRRVECSVLLALWAVAVAVSRVAMGRHHVLDVVFGLVIGTLYVLAGNKFWIGNDVAGSIRLAVRGLVLKR